MDTESLLAHEPFVRAVARALLRGDARVDDVVQETWLAALKQGESSPRWLAAVARNVARTILRKDRRRARIDPQPAVPSAADIASREEIRRQVLGELLSIAEPYRSSLLLRYYEDLPPREIAKRLGVPVETARTRVKRGLGKLRERLDAQHGGKRAAWATGLLPFLRGGDAAAAGAAAGRRTVWRFMPVAAGLAALIVSVAVAIGSRAQSERGARASGFARGGARATSVPDGGQPQAELPAPTVRASGVVLGPTGAPSAGAVVLARREAPRLYRGWSGFTRLTDGSYMRLAPCARAVSRDDGTFELDLPQGEAVSITGLGTTTLSRPVRGLDTRRDVVGLVVRLRPRSRLAGVVRDAESRPIAGARVFATPVSWPWKVDEVESAVTGKDGRFVLDAVLRDRYRLLVAHRDHVGRRVYVRAPEERLFVQLGRGLPVAGVVRARGAAVPGAVVTVIPADFSYQPSTGLTDEHGRFRVPAGADRPFRFIVAVDGFAAGYATESEIVWTRGHDLEMDLPATRALTVRTVGPDGRSVPGVELRTYYGQAWYADIYYGGGKAPREITTGPDGSFLLTDRTGDEAHIEVADPDWFARPLRVPTDSDTADVGIVPARNVDGVVLDHEGKPVAGAKVAWGSVSYLTHGAAHTRTGSDGSFALRLAAGSHLHAIKRGVGQGSTKFATDGDAFEIVLARPKVLAGRVVDEQGSPVGGARVATPPGAGHRITWTDAEGRWTLESFPGKAKLRLVVEHPDCETRTVHRDGEIVLRRMVALAGTVQDPSGRPVAGARIGLHVPGRSWEVNAAEDGSFVIAAPPDGDVRLHVWAPDHVSRNIEMALPAAVPLALVLQPGRTIAGRLFDLEGRPVARARVTASRKPWEPGASASAYSDREGNFVVRGLTAGRFGITVGARDALFAAVSGVEAGTADLVLRAAEPTHVEGRVVWPEGVEPARITIYCAPIGPAIGRPRSRQTEDAFRFDRLVGPRFRLWAQHSRYAALPVIASGGDGDVALRLSVGVTIRGIVSGADGTPTQVYARPADGRGEYRSATTDASGRFVLAGLAPGRRYVVEAHSPDRKRKGTVPAVAAPADGVVITLAVPAPGPR